MNSRAGQYISMSMVINHSDYVEKIDALRRAN
jgi:hypothetical protein